MDFGEIVRFARSLDLSSESIDRLYAYLLDAFQIPAPPQRETPRKGILVTFDGHSGSGKDTQIALVQQLVARSFGPDANDLRIHNVVLKTSDPFRSVAKFLWANSDSETNAECSFLLLSAGRRYVADAVVGPLLEDAQNLVFQNRSYLSHVAYHATDQSRVAQLLDLCACEPRADVALVLTCDTGLAEARIRNRASQKLGVIHANETREFIDRVKKNFEHLTTYVDKLAFVDTSDNAAIVAQRIFTHFPSPTHGAG